MIVLSAWDGLILAGIAIAAAGLYLVAWPLTLVLAGGLMVVVGMRRV